MIDNYVLKRNHCCLVEFKDLRIGDWYDAIYIENEYHKETNRLFRWRRRKIKKLLKKEWINLIYIPEVAKKVNTKRQILYRAPFLHKGQLGAVSDPTSASLLKFLADPDDARFIEPGFLFFFRTLPNGNRLYLYYKFFQAGKIRSWLIEEIKEIAKNHTKKIERLKQKSEVLYGCKRYGQGGLYSTVKVKDKNWADNNFDNPDKEISTLLQRLERDVRHLKQRGISMQVLEQIIHQEDVISRLFISKDYKIFLPDYNNMEIKMEPLVKAVFFLFLKHPEGIRFKQLPDYREELASIYKELRPLGLNKRTLQSIEDVTNPLLNSINEKCARIRAAFVKQFDEHLAKNYFVTGERGMPKKITLPRDLVVWEKE